MSILRGKATRLLVLALLAGLLAGPTGVAGVLHPNDDSECGSVPDRGADSAPAWSAAAADPPHCPTCHLLRSVRWGLSASPVPSFARMSAPSPAPAYRPSPSVRVGLTSAGRSPPSNHGERLAS